MRPTMRNRTATVAALAVVMSLLAISGAGAVDTGEPAETNGNGNTSGQVSESDSADVERAVFTLDANPTFVVGDDGVLDVDGRGRFYDTLELRALGQGGLSSMCWRWTTMSQGSPKCRHAGRSKR
jgi:hypothetical protein